MHNASTKRTFRHLVLGVLFVVFCCLWGALGQAQPGGNRIVINIPATTLYLYAGDTLVRSYPVGVGKAQFPTPMGRYQVIRKVVNPGWENPYLASGRVQVEPGQDNPLGTRWIGFKESAGGEYGIHGTDRPSSVGQFSSHGCVRMRIPDAEDLFGRVSVGTPVEVTYNPVSIQQSQGKVTLQTYPDPYRKGYPSPQTLHQRIATTYPDARIQPPLLMSALKSTAHKPLVVATIQSDAIPLDNRLAMGGESDLVLKGGPRGVQTDVPVNVTQAPSSGKPSKTAQKAKPATSAVAKPPAPKPETSATPVKPTDKAAQPEPAATKPAKSPAPADKPAPPVKPLSEKPVQEPPPVSSQPAIPFADKLEQLQDKMPNVKIPNVQIPKVEIPSAVPHLPNQSTGLILILAIVGAIVVIRVMIVMTRKFSEVKATLQTLGGEPDHATVMAHEPMMLRDEAPEQMVQPASGGMGVRSPYVAGQAVVEASSETIPTISIPDTLYDEESDEAEAEDTVEEPQETPVVTEGVEEDRPSAEDLEEASETVEEETLAAEIPAEPETSLPSVSPPESPFTSSLQRYFSLSEQQRPQ